DSTVQRLAANPRATRELALAGRVRVRIEYRLAEVEADSVTQHPDVYARVGRGYAARVRVELRAAGEDPALALDRAPAATVRIARAVLPVREPLLAMDAQAASVVGLQR
ncbi:MAG TPA: hypothetical protein VFX98_12820, partial [Longimicrobiaceae bacterium]|nr:hypothetical protein [Longimicrobiaceae bacterium]